MTVITEGRGALYRQLSVDGRLSLADPTCVLWELPPSCLSPCYTNMGYRITDLLVSMES